MWRVRASAATETEEEVLELTEVSEGWHIVLYNDDHNTFDHVIECLMRYCKHDPIQAEQCAVLVHFRGKCTVKSGSYDELEPVCSALLTADLTAEIEP